MQHISMFNTSSMRICSILKEKLIKLHIIVVREWAPVLATWKTYISGLPPVRNEGALLIGIFMSAPRSMSLLAMSISFFEQAALSADPCFPPVVSTSAPCFRRSSIGLWSP